MHCCHGASLVRERVEAPALQHIRMHARTKHTSQFGHEALACSSVLAFIRASSSMPLMPFSRATHVGRSTTRYSFEISSLNIERMPCSNLSATGLIVQCRRGPKVASTTTVELTPAMKAAAGGVSFGTQKLSFSATLCAKRLFSTVCPKRERPP